jgi:hypothetical protein
MQEGQKFSAAEENTDINIYTLSKHKHKHLQKNILMKKVKIL